MSLAYECVSILTRVSTDCMHCRAIKENVAFLEKTSSSVLIKNL